MYRIGEVVSYGTVGICTVDDIRMESSGRGSTKKQEYYVLKPSATPTCMIYVPRTNESLTKKMRPILTKVQIDEMISSARGKKVPWIEDTRQRTDAYQQIVLKGISEELLLLIACLYEEKRAREEEKRKFCATDEKLLASAERLVSEEFSYSLQISREQVSAYIAQKIKTAI